MKNAEEKIRRASEARHVLEHQLTVAALADIRADIYAKIEERGGDAKALQALYHQLKAAANFEAQLRFHIEEGRIAQSMIDKWDANRRARAAR